MQRDLLLIDEMIDAAEQAQQIASETTAAGLGDDRRLRDALAWNFTVLGEAATQVSQETKSRFPDIRWQLPARLRNRIVHGYWSVDMELLHTTAIDQLPDFVDQLRGALRILGTETDVS